MKLLIGADPEVFLWDTKKGVPISAHDLIPGSKQAPHKVKKGAVQPDGLALEFNIDPAASASEFCGNLDTVLEECKQFLPTGVEMLFEPYMIFPKDYYDKLPDSAKMLGCDVDYSASGRTNPIPRPYHGHRSAGGHAHLGWTAGADVGDIAHFYDGQMMASRLQKFFDFYEPFFDPDPRRKSIYGDNASFRPKPYGMEYRALSNAWVKHRKLWPFVFNGIKAVFDHALLKEPLKSAPYFPEWYRVHYRAYQGATGRIVWYDTPGVHRDNTMTMEERIGYVDRAASTVFAGVDVPKFPSDWVQVPAPDLKDWKNVFQEAMAGEPEQIDDDFLDDDEYYD